MNKYKNFLLEKEMKEKENSRRITSEMITKLKNYIPEIVDKYPSIKKIFVFGSVINDSMTEFSDVDIYVDSIEPSQYWELLRVFSSHLKKDVDLLTPDDDPYFKDIIEKNGEVIYEREN
jgi:predicted nucleotidyltransferase